MLTPILDDFNRGDNTSSLGGNWTANPQTGYSSLGILSNQAYAATAWKGNYWNTIFNADQEAYITVSTLPSYRIRLYCRLQNPGTASANAYCMDIVSGVCAINKIVNDTLTWILDGPTISTAGESVGLRVLGNKIYGLYKPVEGSWKLWNENCWVVNNDVIGVGYIGIHIGDETTARIDNFGGGNTPTHYSQVRIGSSVVL